MKDRNHRMALMYHLLMQEILSAMDKEDGIRVTALTASKSIHER